MATPRFSADDVQLIAKERAFQGYFAIDIYRFRHRTFAGGWTGEIRRELFERGHAVVVILYDPDRDEIALIEQFRIGPYAAGDNPWLIECVAGIVENGETPEQVAIRECQEEAGAAPSDIFHVAKISVTPGGSSETVQLYCARIDATQIDGLHGLEHEGEDIRVFTVPVTEAYAMVKDGRINNSLAVIAVQWLMLEREDLKARWSV
jgi:ADP-ribose pyrophosphatase